MEMTKPCRECNGTGSINKDIVNTDLIEQTCPSCMGIGNLPMTAKEMQISIMNLLSNEGWWKPLN